MIPILLGLALLAATGAACATSAAFLRRRRIVDPGTEPGGDLDFAAITEYANGSRRVLLVTEHAQQRADWHAEVARIECCLDHVLRAAGSPACARDLRHHGGRRARTHVLCWQIPGPYGPLALDVLRRELGLATSAQHARIGTATGLILER